MSYKRPLFLTIPKTWLAYVKFRKKLVKRSIFVQITNNKKINILDYGYYTTSYDVLSETTDNSIMYTSNESRNFRRTNPSANICDEHSVENVFLYIFFEQIHVSQQFNSKISATKHPSTNNPFTTSNTTTVAMSYACHTTRISTPVF